MRVLFVAHGHPRERPGGAEVYAWDLYQALKRHPRFEPFILTRTTKPPAAGPPVWADPADPAHHWLYTEEQDFDLFFQEPRSPGRYVPWVERLLRRVRPDVVHVQHTQYVGLNLLRWVKAAVPAARLVYTLHEYVPICHQRGLFVRNTDGSLCREATPARCRECFPDVSADSFAFRRWHIRSRLDAVDWFVAPSRFLRDRYVEWGLPADRVVAEEYGRPVVEAVPPRPSPDGRRDRFAFFGQLNPFKGADVLLRAATLLAGAGGVPFRLDVFGANLDIQLPAFQAAYRQLMAAAAATGRVFDHGPYPQDGQGRLMAEVDWVVVPSVWWENSPLVIQEAFRHGRPVICSDIGGMAEKVRDGTDGLHFPARDPAALARVLHRAATTPGLWDRLRANVRPPHPLDRHVERLAALYADPAPTG
jgi:glycosyltransferase involved in cell wall biosynthesis